MTSVSESGGGGMNTLRVDVGETFVAVLNRKKRQLFFKDDKENVLYTADPTKIRVHKQEGHIVEFTDEKTKKPVRIPLSPEDFAKCDAEKKSFGGLMLKGAAAPATSTTNKRISAAATMTPPDSASSDSSFMNSTGTPPSLKQTWANTNPPVKTYSKRPLDMFSRKAPFLNGPPPPSPNLKAVSLTPSKKPRFRDSSEVEPLDSILPPEELTPSKPLQQLNRKQPQIVKPYKASSLTDIFNESENTQVTPTLLRERSPTASSMVGSFKVPKPQPVPFQNKLIFTRHRDSPNITQKATARPAIMGQSYQQQAGNSHDMPESVLRPRVEPRHSELDFNLANSVQKFPVLRKGYPNPSCVCYCNAVVQALVTCAKFEEEMLTPFWRDVLSVRNAAVSDPKVFNGLQRCFLAAKSGENVNPATMILPAVGPPFANIYSQEDAHEFYLALLHKVENELAGEGVGDRRNGPLRSQLMQRTCESFPNTVSPNTFSVSQILPTSRVFEATLQKDMTCTNCNFFHHGTPETFLVHSLDFLSSEEFPEGVPLATLFERNLHDEHTQELKCEKCADGQRAKVHTNFISLPRVLVVHIKRFSTVSRSGGFTLKRKDRVLLPKQLNISSVVNKDGMVVVARPELTPPPSSDDLKRAQYKLIAAVFHEGPRASSGHYTTVAQVSSADDNWCLFDDERVSCISPNWNDEEACQRKAYMCFYQLQEEADCELSVVKPSFSPKPTDRKIEEIDLFAESEL